MSDQVSGTVRWYSAALAYGFISADDGRDVFVHRSAIADGRAELEPGQAVTFAPRESARGMQAGELRVVAEAPEGAGRRHSALGSACPHLRS